MFSKRKSKNVKVIEKPKNQIPYGPGYGYDHAKTMM